MISESARRSPNVGVLSDRLNLLKELRHGGGWRVFLLLTALLVSALVPAATALAIAGVVRDVLEPGSSWGPMVALGLVMLAGRIASVANLPLRWAVAARIDGYRRQSLVELTTRLSSIAPLESGALQDDIRLARADPEFWAERTPGEGSVAQLDLLVRWIGVVSAGFVLASFAWWLPVLVLLPTVGARSIWRRQFLEHIALEHEGIRDGIAADDWRKMATEATSGKETRTFGLAPWALGRAQTHLMRMAEPRWSAGARSVRKQWQVLVLVGVPLTAAYVLVARNAGSGASDAAAVAAVMGSGWAMLNLLGFADAHEIEGAMPGQRAFAEVQRVLADESIESSATSSERAGIAAVTGDPATAVPRVRFEGVSFTYPGTERPILDGLDLEIEPGELLAVVGLNGAGKSTLIKLLAGLYLPTSGRIFMGGLELGAVSDDEWRRHVSVVFQDFTKFNVAASDNVTLGYARRPPDERGLVDAAHAAGLDKVVERLSEGWATPLSRSRRGGVDLSGGQWQHVVLARGLYAMQQGAKILVLDEPTAHLDVRSELRVFERLAKAREAGTMVLISHRLSTVRLADRIVLLEGGRIVEEGDHASLMAHDRTYARMFRIQAERFRRGHDDRQEQLA